MFGLADRGNENNLKSVLVMFWFYWTYMVAIRKKLQTNEKPKRWLTNPKQELRWNNEPRSALTSQTRPPIKN